MLEPEPWMDYMEYWPRRDEEGYDGVHNGGWKWISKDAPPEMKEKFMEYKEKCDEYRKQGGYPPKDFCAHLEP